MTILSRNASLLVARTSLVFVALTFAVVGSWRAGDLLGQTSDQKKQRVEEEEETSRAKSSAGKKPKRKVIHVEGEDDANSKKEANRPAGATASGDLKQLAEQEPHPALKALFGSLAVPHDLVLSKRSSVTFNGEQRQREERRIEPSPTYLGNNPNRFQDERLRFTELTEDGKPDKQVSLDPVTLEAVRPYEEVAQNKVRQFLKESFDQRDTTDRRYLSRYAMLTAAEQALSAVLRWHESAVQTGKRTGDKWDNVEKGLRKQLLDDVLLEQMRLHAQAKEWNRVLELTRRLAVAYNNADERERESIFRPVADMIQRVLKDATSSDADRQTALKRLHELEMEFPGNQAFEPIRKTLQSSATILLKEATDLANDKTNPEKRQRALGLLRQIEDTWPQVEGLRDLKKELQSDYPILRVGIRGTLPKYFSPAWACTDNELRAVEMLFESLVKLVPDGAGGFGYSPGLAEAPPKVVPLGRQFELPREGYWSDRQPLISTDIDLSLQLLKQGMAVGRSRVWGYLFDTVQKKNNPFQVTLLMKQGFLKPLALMTFKILPRDRRVHTEEFATSPVTSGPYLLDHSRRSDEDKRECLFFVANPAYGARQTKHGFPHIQEIRFYPYGNNPNIAQELSKDKLDLVLDLTAKEAEELLKKPNGEIEIPMPSPSIPNRRIYFLAINTRQLPAVDLRQALSCAINREELLNKHFRAALKAPLHKALAGPFPSGSWASKPPANDADNKGRQGLFDPAAAKLLKEQKAVIEAADASKSRPLKLEYPDDDPALDAAMKELCAQVKELTGVVLKPTPRSPYDLRDDVERKKSYDLAYYHYDFPDESYWLAPLFGPPPDADGEQNIFKYRERELTKLLEETKSFRNFATVRQYQWETQDRLTHEMPFIPLWQLDPLLAYRREVQPVGLDPLLVFSNIEEWHLLRK